MSCHADVIDVVVFVLSSVKERMVMMMVMFIIMIALLVALGREVLMRWVVGDGGGNVCGDSVEDDNGTGGIDDLEN